MRAEPPDEQANPTPYAAPVRTLKGERYQVQVRLVGQSRQELEAALTRLQQAAGLQVRRGPRLGRKDEWLA